MRRSKNGNTQRRGAALVIVFVLAAVVAMFASIALTHTSSNTRTTNSERQRLQALYLAEAAVSAGLNQLAVSRGTGNSVSATVGSPDAPQTLSGNFWTSISDNGDETFTIIATGSTGNTTRTLEVVAAPILPGPFETSVFAGNLSDDPAYQLTLGGLGSQADHIDGDIYSGGDVLFEDDATLNGDLWARGEIAGINGRAGYTSSAPKVLDIDYEQFNDFDVKDLFQASQRRYDNIGGWADQLGSSSPAHIFRRNPSDRTSDTRSTAKDDYFLEDPYERIGVDWAETGADATDVSLPASANNSVFFIDGNLWLHNRRTLSLKIKNTGADPTRVTFVVKGNVYFSDNLFYDTPDEDGVAFIALADNTVEDSGNIYFGDPSFGTMRFAESLLFAENDFVDNNLSSSSNSEITLRGNMTAGNQVEINRDFIDRWGRKNHTRLELNFDDRQADGLFSLPGIPQEADEAVGHRIAVWREIPVPDSFAVPSPTIRAPAQFQAGTATPEGAADWRTRWDDQFGDAWQETIRQGLWTSK